MLLLFLNCATFKGVVHTHTKKKTLSSFTHPDASEMFLLFLLFFFCHEKKVEKDQGLSNSNSKNKERKKL